MTASPFTAMASALTRPAFPTLSAPNATTTPSTSRTEQIRQLLRKQGSMTAHEILMELVLPEDFWGDSGLVGALLKNDIAKGQVTRANGKYRWNFDHDEALQNELHQAANLLRRHGYTVEAPK